MNSDTPAKAQLRELDATGHEIHPAKTVTVQFNPETLKVSFANQIQTPQGTGSSGDQPSKQHVGAGTTKLTLQIWFDVTAPLSPADSTVTDVRKLTQKVAYFITPRPDDKDPKQYLPPQVRFVWGSFQFDGLMDALEESLEFFSPQGLPLRASMNLSLSQQKIVFDFNTKGLQNNGPGGKSFSPGANPLTQSQFGDTLQGLADAAGKAANWQAIASANGIENPRLLQPGQLIDLNASASVRIGG
jgi:Contractile injection system tube protein/LysM domain